MAPVIAAIFENDILLNGRLFKTGTFGFDFEGRTGVKNARWLQSMKLGTNGNSKVKDTLKSWISNERGGSSTKERLGRTC
mgnify:CR=1 FL=1